MDKNASMMQCAMMILNNQCPPDNRCYLCKQGEECEENCTECWSSFLFWVANGCKEFQRPYYRDYRTEENI